MRKLISTAILSATLLAGCATNNGGTPATNVADVIRQTQAVAVQICGFLPLAGVVANIIAAGQITTAVGIASAICDAVLAAPPTPTAKRGDARVPVVSGVVIRGSWVNR